MTASNACSAKIKYIIERSKKISGMRITVDAERGVVVTAPVNCGALYIDAFVKEKDWWIKDRLQHLEKLTGCRVPRNFVSGEKLFFLGERYVLLVERSTDQNTVLMHDREIHVKIGAEENSAVKNTLTEWYKIRARQVINERVNIIADAMPQKPAGIKIKSHKSRWGSCSAGGNLNFNWKLVMAPMAVIDYVVAHELCHLYRLDHSTEFWRLVAAVIPDYQKRRRWLKEYGPALTL